MRVLLVCQSSAGEHGGWSRYTAQLRDELRHRGHEVRTCGARGGGADFAILPPAGLLLSRPWLCVAAARRLRSVCREWQPEIIHIIVEPYSLALGLARLSAPVALTIHGSYGVRIWRDQPWLRPLVRRAWRRIGGFIAVSQFTARRVLEEAGLHDPALRDHLAAKLVVIKNGIALPPSPAAREPGIPRRILIVGEVKARKGALQAVRACAEFKRHSSVPFRFDIIGQTAPDSDYVRDIQREIVASGLGQDVILRGEVSEADLQAALSSADLYLMPARTAYDTFEGFGLSYLEAAAHGVPCIGPLESGAAEAIVEGQSGYHVDPTDIRALAGRIADVLERRTIKAADCRTWAEQHSIATQTDSIEALYRQLLP